MSEDIKGFNAYVYCDNLLSSFDSSEFIEKMKKEDNISSRKLADIFNHIVRKTDVSTTNNDTQLKPVIMYLIRHVNFSIDETLLKDFSNQSWIECCFNYQRYWIIAEVIYLIHEKNEPEYFNLLFGNSIKNIFEILYIQQKKGTLITGTKIADDIYFIIFHVITNKGPLYVNEIKDLFRNVIFDGFPYDSFFTCNKDKFYFNEKLMSVKDIYGDNVFMKILSSRLLGINEHAVFLKNLENMGVSDNASFYMDKLSDDFNNNIFHKIPLFIAGKINKVIPLTKEVVSLFFEEDKYKTTPMERIKTKAFNDSDSVGIENALIMFMLQFMPLSPENYDKYCEKRERCKSGDVSFSDIFSLKLTEDSEGCISWSQSVMNAIKMKYHSQWIIYDIESLMSFCLQKYNEALPEDYRRYSDTMKVEKVLKKCHIFDDVDIEKLKESSSTKEKGSVSLIWLDKIINMKGERTLASNANILREIDDLRGMFPNFSEYLDFVEDNIYLNEVSRGFFHLPPSLLLSRPGIGKTFFLSELSSRIGTFYDMINMESINGGFSLTGGAAMYSESDAGRIFKNMHVSPYANPIFVLDEIDKIAKESRYPVEPVLLPLLEEHSAKNFKDEFIGMRCDISRVTWTATANDINAISQPIKDRFEVFEIKAPTFEERKILAQNIYKKVLINSECHGYFNSVINNEALDYLCRGSESSRTMRKDLTKALARAAREKRKEIVVSDIKSTENKKPFGF